MRSVWVPLFEDVPLLHIPFLPSLLPIRGLVRNSRECRLWRCSEIHWRASLCHCNRSLRTRLSRILYVRCVPRARQSFCAPVALPWWWADNYAVPVTRCAPLSDLPVLLLGEDPDMGTPLRGRTPSHTVLTLPAFEKGPGPPFVEGV